MHGFNHRAAYNCHRCVRGPRRDPFRSPRSVRGIFNPHSDRGCIQGKPKEDQSGCLRGVVSVAPEAMRPRPSDDAALASVLPEETGAAGEGGRGDSQPRLCLRSDCQAQPVQAAYRVSRVWRSAPPRRPIFRAAGSRRLPTYLLVGVSACVYDEWRANC